MNCSPGDKVDWSDLRDIAEQVDNMAVVQNATFPEALLDMTSPPFTLTGPVVEANIAIRFEVNSSLIVTKRVLTVDKSSTVPYALIQELEELEAAGDLYFLSDADECWCRTLFKVIEDVPDSYEFVLEEVPHEMGCCQSLFMPRIGDALDFDQNIIPASWAAYYAEYGNPEEGVLRQTGKRCELDPGENVAYEFASTAAEAPLAAATRQLSGRFVWSFKASYFQLIYDRIEDLVSNCDYTNGARTDTVLPEGGTVPGFLPTGCVPSICDYLYTLGTESLLEENPGCLIDACQLPWEDATCEGVRCDSENTGTTTKGYKIYCETMLQLQTAVNEVSNYLQAYNASSNGDCSTACTCISFIQARVKSGNSTTCYRWDYIDSKFITGYRSTDVYYDGGGGEDCSGGTPVCTKIYDRSFGSKYVEFLSDCNDTGEVLFSSSCSEDDENNASCIANETVYDFVGAISCDSFMADARTRAASDPWVEYPRNYFEIAGGGSCDCIVFTTESFSGSWDTVEYRVGIEPLMAVSEIDTGQTFTVIWNETIVQTPGPSPVFNCNIAGPGHDNTLTWDASEEAFLTDWIEAPTINTSGAGCGSSGSYFSEEIAYDLGFGSRSPVGDDIGEYCLQDPEATPEC